MRVRFLVLSASTFGSCVTVIACRLTMQKKLSYSCCNATQVFSGAQPTGDDHIGHDLGALKNWVALQDEEESFFCIVNLHAITIRHDPKVLAESTRNLTRIYLAVGIDPQVSTIFIQSDV